MRIEKVRLLSVSPSAKGAARGFTEGSGFIYEDLSKRNVALIEELKNKVEKELAKKFGVAPMIAPISAIISQAWK